MPHWRGVVAALDPRGLLLRVPLDVPAVLHSSSEFNGRPERRKDRGSDWDACPTRPLRVPVLRAGGGSGEPPSGCRKAPADPQRRNNDDVRPPPRGVRALHALPNRRSFAEKSAGTQQQGRREAQPLTKLSHGAAPPRPGRPVPSRLRPPRPRRWVPGPPRPPPPPPPRQPGRPHPCQHPSGLLGPAGRGGGGAPAGRGGYPSWLPSSQSPSGLPGPARASPQPGGRLDDRSGPPRRALSSAFGVAGSPPSWLRAPLHLRP